MKINSSNVMKIIETFAPVKIAQEWDNVGFQVGNINRKIDKIMVALEVTPDVINEAIFESVDLVIVHHPLIFQSIKSLIDSNPIERMVLNLVSNNINLIVAHTNLDSSSIGLNAYLAKKINLTRISNLTDAYRREYVKFVIYVPIDNKDEIISVLEQAGAGSIGNYSGCTFNIEGMGTFRPLEGSNPAIGTHSVLENVKEVRIETIVDKESVNNVISKAIKAHPYETPAFDIIPLLNEIDNPNMGLIGYLDNTDTIINFTEKLKRMLNSDSIKLVQSNSRKINKIALCTGASSGFMDIASKKGADIFITGDLKYHEAQHAKLLGINVIDAGHFETEQFFIEEFVRILKDKFEIANYDVAVIASKIYSNPFTYL